MIPHAPVRPWTWHASARGSGFLMVVFHLISTSLLLHSLWTVSGRPVATLSGVEATCVVRPDMVEARWCEQVARRWLLQRYASGNHPNGRRVRACVDACSRVCAVAISQEMQQDLDDATALAKATLVYSCTLSSTAARPGCWRVDYVITRQSFYGPLAARAERLNGHLDLVRRPVQLGDIDVLAVDDDTVDKREVL